MTKTCPSVVVGLAAGLFLVGCDGGQIQGRSTTVRFVSELSERINDRQPTATIAELRAFVPTALAQVAGPLMLVEQPIFDQGDFFVPAARNGAVVTWGSDSQRTVATVGAIIVATRGLGEDLMASDVGSLPDLLAAQTAGRYPRSMTYLTGAGDLERLRFDCALEPVEGPDAVWREYCGSEQVEFVNFYRFGPGGQIAETEQWIGVANETLVLNFLRL